jgi:hypothetical protein
MEAARSAVECGRSSYRFPPYDSYRHRVPAPRRKAVAAATALHSGGPRYAGSWHDVLSSSNIFHCSLFPLDKGNSHVILQLEASSRARTSGGSREADLWPPIPMSLEGAKNEQTRAETKRFEANNCLISFRTLRLCGSARDGFARSWIFHPFSAFEICCIPSGRTADPKGRGPRYAESKQGADP